MTDKQIIYDCPHISFTDWGTYACKLYNPRDKNCLVKGGNCDSNISCPYKQLKRKEQECDELKEKNKLLMIKATEGISKRDWAYEQRKKKYNQLKAENEELQKLIAQDQCFQNKSHKCVKSFYIDERYKQAIEKIKEIAEKHKATAHCDYLTDMDKILQKISECEVNDE